MNKGSPKVSDYPAENLSSDTVVMATTSGEAMQSMQAHMEDMRSLTLCKICLRPFYEPFILGCGHSFCYSCLRSWLGGPNDRRKNRNCPDCRTDIKSEPAPNYLLREISHLFLTRQELLPEDETVAEHKKDQDEETELLGKDRRGEGLFQGVFKLPRFHTLMPGPIHDFEDRVDRCPVCAWEIEDGRCNRCGLTLGDYTDISESESDLSGLSDMDDDSQSESSEDGSGHDQALPYPHFHAIEIEEDEDDEDDSDVNEYDRHDDFIDNEDELDLDDVEMPGDYDNYPTDAATPYSEEDQSELDIYNGSMRRRPVHIIHDSDEESISTNPESPESSDRIGRPRRRRQVVISSDEEDEEAPPSRLPVAPSLEPSSETRPFMMPDLNESNSDEDPNADDSEDESSSDDGKSSSDSESADSNSDSDSSDATIEDSTPYGGNQFEEDSEAGGNAGEDSDDTVIPPQSKRTRQNRLQEHRDNRGRRSLPDDASGNVGRGRLRMSRDNRRGRLTSVY